MLRAGVVTFPGSNCDRDARVALARVTGHAPVALWHKEREVPALDLIVLPGGFSYGDYLRPGAIAARSPIMETVVAAAKSGTRILGICNGFQILVEAGLLPGALMRNRDLHFVCRPVPLRVEQTDSPFTAHYQQGETITLPVAHHDGNYVADPQTLDRLNGEGRVAFRYHNTPNGSVENIAGILNPAGTVLGMMPHPERAADPALGHTDGTRLFASLMERLAA